MKPTIQTALLLGWFGFSAPAAETVLFQDEFKTKPADGWSWLREDTSAWRVASAGLEIRVQPGNLWGGANNARNVLSRPIPSAGGEILELLVTVENQPTGQYEQANLAWYYDDSHMVKLGQELVDGKLCVVMGREEANKTRTLGITPLNAHRVRLRLRVDGNQIRGEFMPEGSDTWQSAGAGELPAPPAGQPKASLHAYQGLADVEHWARFSQFRIVKIGK